ncbi:hypothetical protein A6R68_12063 [Neotoma lepida]|uniref:Uncharacterized protein n=1 Tax=Neotoma lepida TaxID=56216 RepID=A0A1A6H4Y5_NEOLE|nr:hypothetical protein A6R68_12063 [Neotoma lepida]
MVSLHFRSEVHLRSCFRRGRRTRVLRPPAAAERAAGCSGALCPGVRTGRAHEAPPATGRNHALAPFSSEEFQVTPAGVTRSFDWKIGVCALNENLALLRTPGPVGFDSAMLFRCLPA